MLKQSPSVTRLNETMSQGQERVSDRIREIHDLISSRAFEIFEASGRPFGHDLDHWFRAESELLHTTPLEMWDSDGALIVRAEVPGFKAHEIEVIVEPRRLSVFGKRESKDEPKADKLIYSDQCTDRILRVIEFPWQVDTERASASLKDGILELTLPKAAVRSAAEVKSHAA